MHYYVKEFGTRLENSVISGREGMEYRVFSPAGNWVKSFQEKQVAEDFVNLMNRAREDRKVKEE